MKLILDRTNAARISNMNWNEFITGVTEQWLEPSVAVDFAIKQIESGSSEPIVLDLAACAYSDKNEIQNCLYSRDDLCR